MMALYPDQVHRCYACDKRRICVNGPSQWEWYCKAECAGMTEDERSARATQAINERNAMPPKAPRFAYPIIGGPYDGLYGTTEQMNHWRDDQSKFGAHSKEYREFNAAGYSGKKKVGGKPSMVFIHDSLLKPLIAGGEA